MTQTLAEADDWLSDRF